MSGAGPYRAAVLGAAVLVAALLLMAAAPAAPPDAAAIFAHGLPPGLPACATCHGAEAQGNAAGGFPRLAGAPEAYLATQLADLASGARENAIMGPYAKQLDPAQLAALAAYLAAMPAPLIVPPAKQEGLGATLALDGRDEGRLPACVSCHGPQGMGVGSTVPPLAGQPAAYIAAQLGAWQDGKRPPGPLGLMPAIAKRLSKDDIAAVAAYFAALVPGPASVVAAAAPLAAVPPAAAMPAKPVAFTPPARAAIPKGPLGDMIRKGEAIFRDTGAMAPHFVGNALVCSNCHIDAGRLAEAAPMWAGWIAFPTYRAKDKMVETFAQRMQGCFTFSMNGKAPPLGDEVLVALEAYSAWLATNAPTGVNLPGRGYTRLAKPAQAPDEARGEAVYEQHCALCHGAHGEGQSTGGKVVFPPLWGAKSFNWGAGMEAVDAAAGFVRYNMPLGLGGSLSDQEAWDVALYLDSQERPQDPRFTGDVAQTRKEFHDGEWDMYGRTVGGAVLGANAPPFGTTR